MATHGSITDIPVMGETDESSNEFHTQLLQNFPMIPSAQAWDIITMLRILNDAFGETYG